MNKNIYKHSLMALAVFALSTITAQADRDDGPAFYIGAGASLTEIDGSKFEFEDSDSSVDLRMGYMFTKNIGLELGYQDFGSFSEGDADLDLDAYSAALVATLPLDNFDLYGKIGASQINGELKIAGNSVADEDAANLFFGGGAEIDMGSLNIFAEYTVTQFDEGQIDTDINRVTVGLKLELPN